MFTNTAPIVLITFPYANVHVMCCGHGPFRSSQYQQALAFSLCWSCTHFIFFISLDIFVTCNIFGPHSVTNGKTALFEFHTFVCLLLLNCFNSCTIFSFLIQEECADTMLEKLLFPEIIIVLFCEDSFQYGLLYQCQLPVFVQLVVSLSLHCNRIRYSSQFFTKFWIADFAGVSLLGYFSWNISQN